MLGPLDYALWLAGFVMQLAVVATIFWRRAVLRYSLIVVYMLCAALVQGTQFIYLLKYGITSRQYYFAYYYLENVLTLLLFFVVIQLCHRVFALIGASRYVRVAAALLVTGTALISYFVIRGHREHMTKDFVIQFGQDIYFVGVVLTYLLWVVILRLRNRPARLTQVVLALGIYFGATAVVYALRNLFPALENGFFLYGLPISGLWLPVAWTYTFLRTPDGESPAARLTPSSNGPA